MKGYLTSFVGMYNHADDGRPPVQRVEIPLIQRDYAQGRTSPNVDEIRGNFLDVLYDAASGREPVGLDFVYGTVQDGTLRPLDGQQRLTTLFLLHWYLACQSGHRPAEFSWAQFSYATRDSARRFCQQLIENPWPAGSEAPSTWLVNQPWYRYDWESDPSIQSMLVVIDDINARFRDLDPRAAWDRITDSADPAISFHLLPIENMGSEEQLYIKMNSRGKPLTPFENFKARFEATLKELDPDRAKVFAHKIDGDWSDLLWPIHGGDNIVDDEFMRYLEFIAELCEWREGRLEDGALGPRMRSLFALDNPRAHEHLDFLFQAFESWESSSAADDAFRELFTTRHDSHSPEQIVLFGNDVNVNLFEECCHMFGDLRGKTRMFSYPQSLLLYAVLLHRIHTTEDFPRRLRTLRNLLSASENEVRRDNMPALTQEVEDLVRHGLLSERSAFNRAQIEDEQRKRRLLDEHPHLAGTLFGLEDEPILRGSLIAFELHATTLEAQAGAFHSVLADTSMWAAAARALLATGEYQRQWRDSDSFLFGTGSPNNEGVWRELLTGTGRRNLAETRVVLADLLDTVAAGGSQPADVLRSKAQMWLDHATRQGAMDWRYYLVKYEWMREGASGLYYGRDGKLGYSLVMLRRTQLNSNYRDAFLYAVYREAGSPSEVDDPWFTGYTHTPRWLTLRRTGTQMRAVDGGYVVQPPADLQSAALLQAICDATPDVTRDGDGLSLLAVRQMLKDGELIDAEDRVSKGAAFLRSLVEAGL